MLLPHTVPLKMNDEMNRIVKYAQIMANKKRTPFVDATYLTKQMLVFAGHMFISGGPNYNLSLWILFSTMSKFGDWQLLKKNF